MSHLFKIKDIFFPISFKGRPFFAKGIMDEGMAGGSALSAKDIRIFDSLVDKVNAAWASSHKEFAPRLSEALREISKAQAANPHPMLSYLKICCFVREKVEALEECRKVLLAFHKKDPLIGKFFELYSANGKGAVPGFDGDVGCMLNRSDFCKSDDIFHMARVWANVLIADLRPLRGSENELGLKLKSAASGKKPQEGQEPLLSGQSLHDSLSLSCARYDFEEALEYANRIVELSPQSEFGYLARGFVIMRLALAKDMKKKEYTIESATLFNEHSKVAHTDFDTAIKMNPKNPHGYFSRAFTHMQADDFASALSDLEKLESLVQGNAELSKFYRFLHHLRAQAYLGMGMELKARDSLLVYYENKENAADARMEYLINIATVFLPVFNYLPPCWVMPGEGSVFN
ncbi:MAG: hypothetical protein NT051_06495 [Candidatus Micrarchaeota archaeon]|nr:hypothetical protein [Candidatus Micrarchaeota archaeon]